MKHVKTISEFHEFRNLAKSGHPLISVINVENVKHLRADKPMTLLFNFYSIAVK